MGYVMFLWYECPDIKEAGEFRTRLFISFELIFLFLKFKGVAMGKGGARSPKWGRLVLIFS